MQVLSKENLLEVVEYLKAGKTTVFPTETSYGLGCDATNQEAVNKIFKIKGRKSDKPLLVVAPTVAMTKKYLMWNKTVELMANSYWPGALTIVGEWNKKEKLATGVVSADNTIAIRVTNHPIPKFLSEKLGRPLVATSANLAGAGDIYSAQEAERIFSSKEFRPDIIIDGGELPHNQPTTIVSAVDELKILRQGQLRIT